MGREQRRRQAAEAAGLRAVERRREWVGGRRAAPFYVTEGEPYRPDIILWLELPDDLIVQSRVIGRSDPEVSFGKALRDAMRSPLIGPPREPDAVRVADAKLAAEVRKILPAAEVVVAPTPELDRILESMGEAFVGAPDMETESYFEDGRVSPKAVSRLFEASKFLFEAAPWEVASDSDIVRLDIPDLGVRGACLSIIGALGESVGLVFFPSNRAFIAFLPRTQGRGRSEKTLDLGSDTLLLSFQRGADLPPPMHREALEHGWPVAAAEAYPVVHLLDPDGLRRPLTELDVGIVSACAATFSSFFLMHRELFLDDEIDEPVCLSFTADEDIEVRFTYPYDAWVEFAVNPPPPSGRKALVWSPAPASARGGPSGRSRGREGSGEASSPKLRRNDPCPCGSGKKFKKCCMLGAESTGPANNASAGDALATDEVRETFRAIEDELVPQMFPFADRRFGEEWRRRIQPESAAPPAIRRLTVPCALYHFEFQGLPIVEWFLDANRSKLSRSQRSWLEAQQAGWLSVWETIEVEKGRSLLLRDLLTGETRRVREVLATETLVKRDGVLGRVVDYGGLSFLSACHGQPLPPEEAAAVVDRVRRHLRRKGRIPPERLRDEKAVRYMISRWNKALEEQVLRALAPVRLANTDGHALRITIDSFGFAPEDLDGIRARIVSLAGVEEALDGDLSETVYNVTRPSDPARTGLESAVIGELHLSDDALVVHTNSVERADALREQLESTLASLIRHQSREYDERLLEDLRARARLGRSGRPESGRRRPGKPRRGEMAGAQITLDFKSRHYATWPDHPLPSLDGRTPREAVRTKQGKQDVDLLLKDMENREARLPKRERYDFARLREQLGLEE